MSSLTVFLLLIILALFRENKYNKRKLKEISQENPIYNKLYEENMMLLLEKEELQERVITLSTAYKILRLKNITVPYGRNTFFMVKISNENLQSMFSKN